MIIETFIAFLALNLVAASLKVGSNAAGAATSPKGLHLSVTTGTPGIWYPGMKSYVSLRLFIL